VTAIRSPFEVALDLLYPEPRHDSWDDLARPEQRPPDGDWLVWVYLAGRGAGKTRSAAEFVKGKALDHPGVRVALVARTFADGRDTMVEGESGLLAILEESDLRGGDREKAWNRSLGELYLANGSRFKIYSSEKPASLRGPQHHYAWGDEAASWLDAHLGDSDDTTWSNLMLGLRLGSDPRCVVSTTPKPVKLLRGTRERPGVLGQPSTMVTRGSTYDNLANLAPTFRAQVLDRYEGTRLGRQELHAELLEDIEGALWTLEMIDRYRLGSKLEHGIAEGLAKVVVGVDPAATSTDEADETGIVVAGKGNDGRGYVLDDRSCRASPNDWGRRAIQSYRDHEADLIVAEANNGGEMVAHVLKTVDARVPVRMVHASRGKRVRAEPVAALYEQGKVSHIGGFSELEDQLTSWVPDSGESPDRMDALVWAMAELFPFHDRGDVSRKRYRDRRLIGR
jgi:predicted phage terminase large subunit-like protein